MREAPAAVGAEAFRGLTSGPAGNVSRSRYCDGGGSSDHLNTEASRVEGEMRSRDCLLRPDMSTTASRMVGTMDNDGALRDEKENRAWRVETCSWLS